LIEIGPLPSISMLIEQYEQLHRRPRFWNELPFFDKKINATIGDCSIHLKSTDEGFDEQFLIHPYPTDQQTFSQRYEIF